MQAWSLILILSLFCKVFFAETVVPVQTGKIWGVELRDLPLPEADMRKGIQSGLTTLSAIEITLKGASVPLQTEQLILKQYYDLWEENYYLQVEGRRMVEKKGFKTLDALFKQEKTIRLDSVGSLEKTNDNIIYQIKVRYLLNPIDKTKTEKIRAWIAENRVNVLNANKSSGMANSAGVSFNALFNTILNEYFVEGGPSAKWEITLESAPFQFKGGKLAK